MIKNDTIHYTGTNNMTCSLNHTFTPSPPTLTPKPTFIQTQNVAEGVTNFAEICGNKSSILLLVISFLLFFFCIYVFSVVGELRHRQVFDNKRQQLAREDEMRLNV